MGKILQFFSFFLKFHFVCLKRLLWSDFRLKLCLGKFFHRFFFSISSNTRTEQKWGQMKRRRFIDDRSVEVFAAKSWRNENWRHRAVQNRANFGAKILNRTFVSKCCSDFFSSDVGFGKNFAEDSGTSSFGSFSERCFSACPGKTP